MVHFEDTALRDSGHSIDPAIEAGAEDHDMVNAAAECLSKEVVEAPLEKGGGEGSSKSRVAAGRED